MEELNRIWQIIAPYFSGVTIGGLLAAVIYGCLKGAFNRTIGKINVDKIAEQATEKGIDKIKEVSFKQSIQPLVESALVKIDEKAAVQIKEELKQTRDNYEKLVNVLEKLAAYFDGSIGVSAQAKTELHDALAQAHNLPVTADSVEVEQVIMESDNKAQTPEETAKAVR